MDPGGPQAADTRVQHEGRPPQRGMAELEQQEQGHPAGEQGRVLREEHMLHPVDGLAGRMQAEVQRIAEDRPREGEHEHPSHRHTDEGEREDPEVELHLHPQGPVHAVDVPDAEAALEHRQVRQDVHRRPLGSHLRPEDEGQRGGGQHRDPVGRVETAHPGADEPRRRLPIGGEQDHEAGDDEEELDAERPDGAELAQPRPCLGGRLPVAAPVPVVPGGPVEEHHGEGGDQAEPVQQGEAGSGPISRLVLCPVTNLLICLLTNLLICLVTNLLVYLDPRQFRRRDHGSAPSLTYRAAPRSGSHSPRVGLCLHPVLNVFVTLRTQSGRSLGIR
ncbi:hypothetical protein CITRIK5_60122 [Citricoccus sp. K5]|nr:hypothetical protein CITRIK5_60122 [Citricoccus sp. K5]